MARRIPVLGDLAIKYSGRMTSTDYADIMYIGRRLKVPLNNQGDPNLSEIIRRMIAMTKKELQEPTIKFTDET